MKLAIPKLKGRLARSSGAKSSRVGRGAIKSALRKLKRKPEEPPMPVIGPDLFREFDRMHRQIERLWSRWPTRPRFANEPMTLPEWSPRVDVSEDDKEYLIKAELPGVNRQDVRVTVSDGVLSIRGERKTEVEERSAKFHRREWSYGRFERRFVLPRGIEVSGITSEFKDGMLQVHIPKRREARPEAIEVQIR